LRWRSLSLGLTSAAAAAAAAALASANAFRSAALCAFLYTHAPTMYNIKGTRAHTHRELIREWLNRSMNAIRRRGCVRGALATANAFRSAAWRAFLQYTHTQSINEFNKRAYGLTRIFSTSPVSNGSTPFSSVNTPSVDCSTRVCYGCRRVKGLTCMHLLAQGAQPSARPAQRTRLYVCIYMYICTYIYS